MKKTGPIDWAIILWASVMGLLVGGSRPKPMVPTIVIFDMFLNTFNKRTNFKILINIFVTFFYKDRKCL